MNFTGFLTSLLSVLKSISIMDLLDMGIIAALIYYVLKSLKHTRLFELLRWVVIVFLLYILATQLRLKTVSWLIERLMSVAFISFLVVFQPELRRTIEQLGSGKIFEFSLFRRTAPEEREVDRLRKAIAAVCDGVERMSEKQTGALIVMEKFSSLQEIKPSGTPINADVTPEIIGTIFYEGTPLHDGAMIIHDGKITYAGCVLPLSDNLEISKDLGTRHRAALGLSEISDAIMLVVSEETGIISIAQKGEIVRGLDREGLYNILNMEFVDPILAAKNGGKGLFRRKEIEKR
jgi:diadenylate cyclase